MLATFTGCAPNNPQEKVFLDSTDLPVIVDSLAAPILGDDFTSLVMTTGAEFNSELPNSLEYVDAYLIAADKSALNLGVYATDALYLAAFDKAQRYMLTVEKCRRLASEIGAQDENSSQFAERLESNLDNQDSLRHIINDITSHSRAALAQNDQADLADLIALGGLAEDLYIRCDMLKSFVSTGLDPKVINQIIQPIGQSILHRKNSITELKALLTKAGHSPHSDQLISYLQNLESAMEAIRPEGQVADAGLTPDTFNDVIARVEALRSFIVR